MVEQVVGGLVGYGLGSIPVSRLVARRHGVDLRTTGDGNPGAWNAREQLGARKALPAFLGDGAKGLVAGVAGRALDGFWGGWAGVAGAMVGHAFPAGRPRDGGKSVMTFVGGAFALSPAAACGCLALCGVATALRDFTLGARLGVFAFPLIQLATDPVEHVMGTGVLMTGIGALFLIRRGSRARASAAPDAGPTS